MERLLAVIAPTPAARLRRLALAIGLVALQACVHSAASAGPVARPLLWTMERQGRVSYLLGTVHVGVNAATDLPAPVWAAFRAAPCFVMESDEDAIEAGAVQAMATLPPGQSLARLVKPETWAKLVKELHGRLPAGRLELSQPWFVEVLYMQQHAPAGVAMDQEFAAQAKAAGKRVTFLESWRDALGAFAKVTAAADLDDLVLNAGEAEHEIDALLRAYRTGDEAQVASAMAAIDAETAGPSARRVLLDDRNAQWLPRLIAAAGGGGCFVAVGAAHLVGPGNLRERLAAKGFRVSRAAAPAGAAL